MLSVEWCCQRGHCWVVAASLRALQGNVWNVKDIFPGGRGIYTYFGYGDVPSGRVSIFTILV